MSLATRVFLLLSLAPFAARAAAPVTLEQVLSAPFPSDLTTSPTGGDVAWVLNEHGARNIWIAGPPAYRGRRLTNFHADDGQDIAQLTWTPDARSIVFVRGGDFEFPDSKDPNPASLPQGVSQDMWIIPTAGGAPRKLCEGNSPAVPPNGRSVTFLKKGEVFTICLETAQSLTSSSMQKEKPTPCAGRRMATISPSSAGAEAIVS